ncbi:MAG: hypothetical protein AAF211_29430 [Myxococcota bacterium]
MTTLRIAFLTALAFSSTQAHAVDNWSSFPGAKCVQSGTSGTPDVFLGRISNLHTTQSLTVACPIDRQNVFDGGIAPNSSVWVIDDHPTQSVRCTLYARDMTTNTTVFSEFEQTAAGRNSSAPVELSFSNAHTSNADEVYHFSCVIPPNSGGTSRVLGILIEESGQELN